jgi:hypothetical protein
MWYTIEAAALLDMLTGRIEEAKLGHPFHFRYWRAMQFIISSLETGRLVIQILAHCRVLKASFSIYSSSCRGLDSSGLSG